MSSAVAAGAAATAGLSLAELAARVALSSDADDDKVSEAGGDEGHDVSVQVDALGGVDSTESAREALVGSNPEAEHAVSEGGASDGGQAAADMQAEPTATGIVGSGADAAGADADDMAGLHQAAAPSTGAAAVGEAQAALSPGQEAAAASGPEAEAVAQAAATSGVASDQTVSATDQTLNANASRTGDGANT